MHSPSLRWTSRFSVRSVCEFTTCLPSSRSIHGWLFSRRDWSQNEGWTKTRSIWDFDGLPKEKMWEECKDTEKRARRRQKRKSLEKFQRNRWNWLNQIPKSDQGSKEQPGTEELPEEKRLRRVARHRGVARRETAPKSSLVSKNTWLRRAVIWNWIEWEWFRLVKIDPVNPRRFWSLTRRDNSIRTFRVNKIQFWTLWSIRSSFKSLRSERSSFKKSFWSIRSSLNDKIQVDCVFGLNKFEFPPVPSRI